MIGFERAKDVLEFDKMIGYIAEKCVSPTGHARLQNSTPLSNREDISLILDRVQEMREIFLYEGGLPIWDFTDVRVLLNKIEPAESYLNVEDFISLQNFLDLVSEIHDFSKKVAEKFPELQVLFRQLQLHSRLQTQLKFTFEPSGKIFDNASPELKTIRKQIAKINSDLHTQLDRLMRKHTEHIQDEYMTLRDGRLVVPVREFSLNKVPGIVHGQSGSGATYFVEPMPVVELNNDIQKLRHDEQKEIIKILKRLSNMVREERDQLLLNFELLNQLDVLQAKAKYANETDAAKPGINEDFAWRLDNAKHPILLKLHAQETVPLNMTLGGRQHILIISGPNAGGKTVALKTIGLLQLMFQSGFHIPVGMPSKLPVCRQIFCVIGDEQSIEQDLSTFSSHIKALNSIIEDLDTESLVLIDEIGSGTEPSGGAALATAFLEKMNRSDIATVATTHQNQLKAFASENDGIENAAMQFDMDKLIPLFTLETGIPGSSYTFEICRRLGMDETILTRAKELSGEKSFELDDLLTDMTRKSVRYKQMTDELSIKDSKLASLMKLYEDKNKELKKISKNYERDAKAEARKILDNVNKDIEAAIREIKESQADKTVVKNARNNLDKIRASVKDDKKIAAQPQLHKIEDLKLGQRARSVQFGFNGIISKILKKGEKVEIDRDGVKITVPFADIELIDQANKSREPSPANKTGINVNVQNELDLRGLTIDEALSEVASYLDIAIMSSWSEVRLVHGKGTGTLRKAVHDYLKGLNSIKSYRIGTWGEGDSGVTVVIL